MAQVMGSDPRGAGYAYNYPPPPQAPGDPEGGYAQPVGADNYSYSDIELDEAKFQQYEQPTATRPPKRVEPPAAMRLPSKQDLEETKPKYNDVWAAMLFMASFAVILWLAFDKGMILFQERDVPNPQSINRGYEESSTVWKLTVAGLICTLGGGMMALMLLKMMLANATSVIHGMLLGNILFLVGMSVAAIFSGQLWLCILAGIGAATSVCYYYLARNRIAFASANLNVGSTAIRKYYGPVVLAFVMLFVQLLWQALWTIAMMGAIVPPTISQGGYVYNSNQCETYQTNSGHVVCRCVHEGQEPTIGTDGPCLGSDTGGILFALTVVFIWGSVILSNVVHVATAGVVADWWFNGTQQTHVTWNSFKRSVTYSFGSICFGSLVTAVVRALRQLLYEVRRAGQDENNGAPVLVACAQCLLDMLDGIISYVNRYAYIYMSIYGSSYLESGRSVVELFEKRGLTTIVNDQLISNIFSFCCLVGAVAVTLFMNFIAWAMDLEADLVPLALVLAFFLGLLIMTITSSVLDSAVGTVFVCYAEAPDALRFHDPKLYNELSNAWAEAQRGF